MPRLAASLTDKKMREDAGVYALEVRTDGSRVFHPLINAYDRVFIVDKKGQVWRVAPGDKGVLVTKGD